MVIPKITMFAAFTLMSMFVMAVAAHAGPQVMMYVTVPLDGRANTHVFGLRLDKESAVPDIRVVNPTSPLNRRALVDLQLGADSALRLELDRRLTWDFNRQQWRQSSLAATFTLRIPTRDAAAPHEAQPSYSAPSSLFAHSSLAASLANPLQYQAWQPLVKSLAFKP